MSINETNNLKFAAALIDAAIRVLYNSSKERFNEIFGAEMGPYLWDKFVNHYKAEEGSFICYLDSERQVQLAKAALDYVETDRRSRGTSEKK